MVSEKTKRMWKIKAERKAEIKKQVINFIDLLMEEYDISVIDLE